jgi:hypothetical protein
VQKKEENSPKAKCKSIFGYSQDNEVVQLSRTPTFYGHMRGDTHTQGPHTVAHSALHKTFAGGEDELSCNEYHAMSPNKTGAEKYSAYKQIEINLGLSFKEVGDYITKTMFTPADVKISLEVLNVDIKDEKIKHYLSDYTETHASLSEKYKELTTLKSGLTQASDEHKIVETKITTTRTKTETVIKNDYIDYVKGLNSVRKKIVELINLNPFATYAWDRDATAEQLKGKGERATDLGTLRTAEKVTASNIFDSYSLVFFGGCPMFEKYLQSVLINLPPEELKKLLSTAP